ncbi:MAG: SDR family NAD(P)-dependent oxidoreductase [Minwuia sp.]|nr:SDR family NAD(P)-dependent oxidoreductase [Minwuia sp.]
MPGQNSDKGLVIIAGAGQGLGRHLLARFQAGGYTAVGLVRTMPEQPSPGVTLNHLDLSDADRTAASLADLISRHGVPKVVVHNAAELVISPFADLSGAQMEGVWRNTVLSAFNLAQGTVTAMARAGSGVFLVSGATASIRGGARFAAFASAKFALRGMTQSLAREYQPQGVHVAHVLLDGIIDTPRSRDLHDLDPARMMKPDEIADAYWGLAHQPRSTWTHELDLRPVTEGF